MKVCFETFGCRLNRAEALQQEANYIAAGWEVTRKHSDANLFVVRGCSVTARAQRDCEKLIDHLKRHYPNTRIHIEGCLQKKDSAAAALATAYRTAAEPSAEPTDAVPTRTARAYLKVQDGCAGQCTFCIVPKFRGTSVSTPFDRSLDMARRFIDAGYHEIVVTGCNLALYASQGHRLPELLAALAELTPDCRIRLGSLEPGDGVHETVHAMAEHANICRFLHLPVQSGSNRILSAMRRPYLSKDIDALVREALHLMPDIRLGCDLMTGFPNESELDYIATKGLLKRLPFTHAHIFPYSERPGTKAVALGGKVPREIRSARAHSLARLAKLNGERAAHKLVGQIVEIIVEKEDATEGWTSQYFWCKAKESAPRKACVKVRVTGVHHDILSGQLI